MERAAEAAGVLDKILVGLNHDCMVSSNSRESVSTTGHGLLAAGAVPDTDRVTADGVTTAEGAKQVLALRSPKSLAFCCIRHTRCNGRAE